jgi:hypothetical protein
MRKQLRFTVAAALITAALLACRPAEAQLGPPIGITKGQAVGIIIGIVAVAAAITVGVVYAVKHKPTVTGCAVAGSSGLTLRNEADSQNLLLTGDTAGIKPGDRVKVQGKKQKANGAARGFTVVKVKTDYGACPVKP